MKNILIILPFLIIINSNAQTNIKVGEKAPEINITHWIKNVPENKNINNKNIVLEFWATWCGPCIAAVPHMNEIQNKFKRDDLIYLSLTDEAVDKVERTLKRVDFQSIVASDIKKKTQIAFGDGKNGLVAYPLTVLIDKNGIIKWTGQPNELTEELMNSFLVDSDSKISQTDISSKEGILKFDVLLIDNSIKYHFQFSETESSESSVTSFGNTIFEIKGKTLGEIYAQIFNNIHIFIPERIANSKYDLTYKNVDKSISLQKLEDEMLNYLNIIKRNTKNKIEVLEIEIFDSSLLETAIDKSFSSKSSAGEKIIFTNTDLNGLVLELSKIHKIVFQYDKNDKSTYDFIVEVTSVASTIESLKSYGIKINKIYSEIKAEILEYRK